MRISIPLLICSLYQAAAVMAQQQALVSPWICGVSGLASKSMESFLTLSASESLQVPCSDNR